MRRIPVSQPYLDSVETRLVAEAMERGEISGFVGEFLKRFETSFAEFCGCKEAVAVSNGTVSLHLALAALDVRRGDEVLVSTTTNMATLFSILYQGAIPVPIDIEPDTFNIDPTLLEAKVTPRTKAIMVVHLFGHPVDMDPVMEVARRHNLRVVEDCAEAHGAEYKGRRVGSIGDIGSFSFYGNKIITTGEGGMCTTQDPALAEKMRSMKSLAFGKKNKFMHEYIGYNYRMTNLQAAVGVGQMGKIREIIAKKRVIAEWYRTRLEKVPSLQLPMEKPYALNVYWMYHVALLGKAAARREQVMARLAEQGVETREGFIPANLQEIFQADGWTRPGDCPKANEAAYSTFYLPTATSLTEDDADYVSKTVIAVLNSLGL